MKIKDLPKGTNLQKIKVVLPDNVYKESSLPGYGITSKEVYLIGWGYGDFFVRVDLNKSQVYPLFWATVPADIEEWEICN